MKKFFSILFLTILTNFTFANLNIADYSIASKPWSEELGNHRAIVNVTDSNSAVAVDIPFRLKKNLDIKKIIIIETKTNQPIKKINRSKVNRDFGIIKFLSRDTGLYYIYYMPYQPSKTFGYVLSKYLKNNCSNFFPLKTKKATLVSLEARTSYDSFYPMEVCPTDEELNNLITKKSNDYFVFCEDRLYQTRMKHQLPLKWVEKGETLNFNGSASLNEYYPFQVVLFNNLEKIKNVNFIYEDLKSGNDKISSNNFTCFNLEGKDYKGNYFKKKIDVEKKFVQPFWIGIDIPKNLKAGNYKGKITITSDNYPNKEVYINLNIDNNLLKDRGDNDLWRLSRLRWLNSDVGLDDNIMISPFKDIKINNQYSFEILNRKIILGDNGLPKSILVNNKEILSTPVTLSFNKDENFKTSDIAIVDKTKYMVSWKWESISEKGKIVGKGLIEADGYLEFDINYVSNIDTSFTPILMYSLKSSASPFMMGLNGPATKTQTTTWNWGNEPRDSFWIGNFDGGLYCELQGASYNGPLLNLYQPAPPKNWNQNNSGSVRITKNDSNTNITVNGGSRTVLANKDNNQKFAFIVTPMKEINYRDHFSTRYYHSGDRTEDLPPDDLIAKGINVVNIHHAKPVNPFINYPFATPDIIKQTVKRGHDKNLKIKYYYTVRELSNATYEIWALRSLGDEIFTAGNGGGAIWLQEHLDKDYSPAWYSYNGETIIADAAITTSGVTRWYNYYVEGLKWMVKNYGLDGIYLDDVAFDRTILKRMRRVMQEEKNGTVIDLHSNTGFSKGPAIQYTEFFPYIDRLWFGESFKYDKMSPEAMLVESSGIPFGLCGDMLQDGGNPWRGLIYGMTSRLPWKTENVVSNPLIIWKLWEKVDIKTASFIPYWENSNFINFDNKNIKASAYISKDKNNILIAIANFENSTISINPKIELEKLNLKQNYDIKYIDDLSNLEEKDYNGELTIQPEKGIVLVLKTNK